MLSVQSLKWLFTIGFPFETGVSLVDISTVFVIPALHA